MRKLFTAFVPSVIFVSVAMADPKTDRERAGLIGPVLKVSTVTTLPTREGERVVSTYDSDGQEMETCLYTSPASGGSLVEKSIHTHDAKGNRIATATYNADGLLLKKTTYTYDALGNLIEMASSDDAGLIEKTAYTCNEKGQAIEEIVYYARGPTTFHFTHSYDPKGNRSESFRYARDGSMIKTVYAYDMIGNVTTRATYAADGALLDKLIYTYEFDSRENWVKQTEKVCDPIAPFKNSACALSAVISRTITYEP